MSEIIIQIGVGVCPSRRSSFFLMKNGGEFNLTSGSGGAPPTSGPLLAPVSSFLPSPFTELLFARSDDDD